MEIYHNKESEVIDTFYFVSDKKSVEISFFNNDEFPLIKVWPYKVQYFGKLIKIIK